MEKKNLTIDLNSMPLIECECGSIEFESVFQLRRVSALQSPMGEEGSFGLHVGFICTQCRNRFGLNGNIIIKEIEKLNQVKGG